MVPQNSWNNFENSNDQGDKVALPTNKLSKITNFVLSGCQKKN